MGFEGFRKRLCFVVAGLLSFFIVTAADQTLKLKVTVDGARVNAAPAIEGKTLARLSLNTFLEASPKQGEWYPVSLVFEGVAIKGFIHEMLVNVVSEEEWAQRGAGSPAIVEKTQEEIVHEIESGIETGRDLIRQETDMERVIRTLRPLIAKTFRVSDLSRQRQLAVEIFLWTGLGYAAQGKTEACMEEFGNMYAVDHFYAQEITRNILDPEIIALLQHVEKTSRGEKPAYTLHVSTRPSSALVLIDGEEQGTTPGDFMTGTPIVRLEIRLPKYATVKETLLLSNERTEYDHELEVIGRDVALRSTPADAVVFLDGKETAERTNCILTLVPFGNHRIRLEKKNFQVWEKSFELKEGVGPHYLDVVLTTKNYELQTKWGGLYDKLFEVPVGITLDGDENFCVIDNSDAKVKKFSAQGDLIQDWKLQGNVVSGLRAPGGIVVDSQNFLYVSDSRRHCIWKFYPDGKMSRKWGREGSLEMELDTPGKMAVDSQDNLYVIDTGNMRVIKYSPFGVVQKIWDNPSNNTPMTGIAVNSRDEIFLLDHFHVQKFSSGGERLDSWGEAGTEEGQFNKPQGIFVDEDQFVYIADTGNKRVQKYDETGNYISQWGPPEMSFPMDLTVSAGGQILIVDRDFNRIVAYGIPADHPE